MNISRDLTIVIVLHNASNIIFECLKELSNFQIIIVDNGKNYQILKELNKYDNIIKIVGKKKNLGYGNGINLGFKFIKTDYFLVLNPDVILDELSINELLLISKANPNCAISAPYISTDNDGYSMLPEHGKSVLRSDIQTYSSQQLSNLKPSGNFCPQVTKGCALLINSKHFIAVGMFSKEYFLFWEEVDLCRKLFKKKLSVIISPRALAYHKEGTSAKMNLSVFVTRVFYSEKSPLYYYKVKKNSLLIYFRIIKYLFRSITYFFIFNFKNSLINIIKMVANLSYIISN